MASQPSTPSGAASPEQYGVPKAVFANSLWLALHQALIRLGWIFKLESVVIPAFLDTLDGAGWLRGSLPVLNRIGQSAPSFLMADSVRRMARKKWVLLFSSLGMALPFVAIGAGLAVVEPGRAGWKTAAFLGLYLLFFVAVGLNVLAYGTLQGKLVPPARRGRLLAIGTFGGSLPAVLAAVWLLPTWLAEGELGWAKIFGVAGLCFLVSAAVAAALREHGNASGTAAEGAALAAAGALRVLREDAAFRRLVVVNVLLTSSIVLIPHYQALARERLGLGGGDLMLWVVAQTAVVGLGSVLIGPVADRYGNRRALRIMLGVLVLAPLCALALVHAPRPFADRAFVVVFLLLGPMPLAMRISSNYLLELAPEAEHARYISIVQVVTAAFMLTSPLFGLAIDVLGYEAVFLGVVGLILWGEWLAGGLADPRAS